MAKTIAPSEIKANKNKHQPQPKTPTPSDVENTMFHQFSLDKPQDKLRSLKQLSKSMLLWPRHNCHKVARIIINDHKHKPLAIHNKKNMDHHNNSSQNRGRTIQLKVISTWEMNTMTEQTCVITKALP
jgi:hypothetical protein